MPDVNGNAQPGDRLFQAALTGQLDPTRVANLLFQLGPSLPHESLIPVPRFMARGGFQAIQPAAPAVAAPAPTAQVAQPVITSSAGVAQPVQVLPLIIPAPARRPSIPTISELGGRQAQTVIVPVKWLPGL